MLYCLIELYETFWVLVNTCSHCLMVDSSKDENQVYKTP